MLNNLSETASAYSTRRTVRGSPLKQDFLNLEKRWLDLAQSFRFGEQLTDFTNEANRKASATITPFLQGQAFRSRNRSSCGKCVSYDVRGAWIEQPGRRHDPISCRKDHRIGEAWFKKSDRVAFGRAQGIWVISPPAASHRRDLPRNRRDGCQSANDSRAGCNAKTVGGSSLRARDISTEPHACGGRSAYCDVDS